MNFKTDTRFVFLFTGLFFIIAFIGILNHEMWRDELLIWLFARDSNSLPELFVNTNTEGHPMIWYVLVFLISKLTGTPFFMQLFNLLLGTASVFVILKFAPFPKIQKTLLCFSYFILYEYTIISRSYALEFLFIFIFCALYEKRKNNYTWLSIILFLLSNTNLYGTIIAACLGLTLILELIWGNYLPDNSVRFNYKILLFVFIFLLGVASGLGTVIYQVMVDGYFSSSMAGTDPVKNLQWFSKNIAVVFYAFFPIPNFYDAHFWNTNILMSLNDDLKLSLNIFLSLLLYIAALLIFIRKPLLFILFFLASLTMWILIAFIWHGQLRHHGHIFLLFIICCWLSQYISSINWLDQFKKYRTLFFLNVIDKISFKISCSTPVILVVLLICQLLVGLFAFYKDWGSLFSNAQKAGNFLSKPEFRQSSLVGHMDFCTSPIATYLDEGRQIYFPQSKISGTFNPWGKSRNQFMDQKEALNHAVFLLQKNKKDVILILSHYNEITGNNPIGSFLNLAPDQISIKHLKNLGGAIVLDENYSLYRLSLINNSDTNNYLHNTLTTSVQRHFPGMLNIDYTIFEVNENHDAVSITGRTNFTHWKTDYTKIFIYLKSDSSVYLFKTQNADANSSSVFAASIDKNIPEAGIYQVGLFLISQSGYKSLQFIKSIDGNEFLTLSFKSEKKKEVEISGSSFVNLPAHITENATYLIEKIIQHDEIVDIEGWATNNYHSSGGNKIFISLLSNKNTYLFKTKRIPRFDVSANLEMPFLFDKSGFSVSVHKSLIQNGNYKLGMLIINEAGSKTFLFPDNKQQQYQINILKNNKIVERPDSSINILMSNKINIPLKITDKAIYAVENLIDKDSIIQISGWVVINDEYEKNKVVSLSLVSADTTYQVASQKIIRYDVSESFEIPFLFDESGFSAQLNKRNLKTGNYILCFHIGNFPAAKIICTDIIIEILPTANR